jgi:hypothetical protein
MDAEKQGDCVDWIELAQDVIRWLSLMKTVTSRRVLQEADQI